MAKKDTTKKQAKELVNNYDYFTKPWIFGQPHGDARATNHSEATSSSYVISSDECKKED